MTLIDPTPSRRSPEQPELAAVIPLSPRPSGPTRAAEILSRRVGEGWERLPHRAGRPALHAEELLEQCPGEIDGTMTPVGVALVTGQRLTAAGRITLGLLAIEVVSLAEALSVELDTLELDEIDALAAAILDLSEAPAPAPSWGQPAAAEGAEVVLDLIAPALQDAAAAHERLYERFTDHVWEIPPSLLSAGRRRRHPLARTRLNIHLRRASRTGRRPGRTRALAEEIIEVRAIRARLAPLRPLMARHLGSLDRGVFTDVAAAADALAAVRRLHQALETVLDADRLERLLLADAFRSHELLTPAQSIRTTLAAWVADAGAAGGGDALGLTADALSDWVGGLERALPSLADGIGALEELGVASSSLHEVVDALVLREQVADETDLVHQPAPVESTEAPTGAVDADDRWSAS